MIGKNELYGGRNTILDGQEYGRIISYKDRVGIIML